MKHSHPLDILLGSPGRVAILRALVSTRAELTGGEAARLAAVSWPQALDALQRFTEAGIVTRKRAGAGGLYLLNRERDLVRRGIIPLFSTEKDLVGSALKKFSGAISDIDPISVILFGSTARGDRKVRSDIDVLVVLPKKNARLVEIVAERAADVGSVAGLHISPLVMSADDLKKASGTKKSLLENIRNEGKLIAGKELGRVTNGKNA